MNRVLVILTIDTENLPANFPEILQQERIVVAQWKKEGLQNLYFFVHQNIEKASPLLSSHFIQKMNENANLLKMTDTRFVEPTGLSPLNSSSVRDIVTLTKTVSQYDIVKTAAIAPVNYVTVTRYTKEVSKKKKKLRHVRQPRKASESSTVTAKIHTHPTSVFFGHEGIFTIKTGFTNAAGFCITMLVAANDQIYNITVLGARTKKERQMFVEQSLKIINA